MRLRVLSPRSCACYRQDVFCKQCRDAIKTYPARLTTTINQYEADLCAYFSVLRDADTSADGPPVAAMAGGQSPSQLAKAQKARSTVSNAGTNTDIISARRSQHIPICTVDINVSGY